MRVHMASRSPMSDDDTTTVRPLPRQPGDQVVDRDAGADVDARGRLAEHEQLRFARQAAAQHDLLLVAAAERRDQRAGTARLDLQAPGPARRRACASAPWPSRPRAPSRPSTDSERFSATENSAMTPSRPRSAGTSGMSRRPASRDLAATRRRARGSRMRPVTALGALPAKA